MQKDLRTAWLLLLLSRGASYGYELRRELRVCATDLDPAVLYRSLRDMEQGGLISSRWMQSQAGPRRRVYDITWVGHDELARIGEKIRSARDAQTTFLQALEQPGRGGTPPLP